MAIRSFLETVACQHIIKRRGYVKQDDALLKQLEEGGQLLARKLQVMRKTGLGKLNEI